MTALHERLKELASRMNQDGDKYDAFTLLAEAATALQSSGGEVVAGKWRQLTTADEVKAALDAEQAVEWTSTATDSIDMPGNREPDSGGWIPHTKNHYTEDRLFKIGKFRAFITASPAQPSGFVLVPVEPTEEQWGGLARDIVMWLYMHGSSRPTGHKLYEHLRMSGVEVPAWLRREIPDDDHVQPKGTIAAVIYKAMLTAAPAPIEQEG